jgi:hypothetical protein
MEDGAIAKDRRLQIPKELFPVTFALEDVLLFVAATGNVVASSLEFNP